jgi:hypothetical protein
MYRRALALSFVVVMVIATVNLFPDRSYKTYEDGSYWFEILRHWNDVGNNSVPLPTYSETSRIPIYITKYSEAKETYRDPDGYAVLGSFIRYLRWTGSVRSDADQLEGLAYPCGSPQLSPEVKSALADLEMLNVHKWRFESEFGKSVSVASNHQKRQTGLGIHFARDPRMEGPHSFSVVGFDRNRTTAVFRASYRDSADYSRYFVARRLGDQWGGFYLLARCAQPCESPVTPISARMIIR